MNLIALVFFAVTAGALFVAPRRWAPVPLLAGCCYMTTGQGIELGPISLPVIRLLLAVGILRVIVRGERMAGRVNAIDWCVIVFGAWTMFASFFHNGIDSGPLFASGVVLNIGIIYYLTRVFCRSTEELVGLIKVVAILLVPIALEMAYESLTGKNLFAALFGGSPLDVVMREGRLRARGPFRHAILAGTVAAACFPLMLGIRKRAPMVARIGMFTTLAMVVMSASSGPVMSLVFAIGALCLWKFRRYARYIPHAAVAAYVALELAMEKPAYYLMARIDLAGGSTGWHRSALIDSAIRYLNEWWLFGTDYTRHWMPTGITFSSHHTDITNYYLGFGVIAGLPAFLAVVGAVAIAFRWCERAVRVPAQLLSREDRWLIWCLGAGLFAHATAAISVPYFDQSFVFFWFNVGVISSFHSVLQVARRKAAREARAAKAATGGDRKTVPPFPPRPAPAPSGAVS